jgi:hypothetical protein
MPGDVDLFSAWFQLQPGLPLTQNVSVTISAFDGNDYIGGVDTFDPNNTALNNTVFGPANIQSATATGAISAAPLPSGASAGLGAILVLAVGAKLHSRRPSMRV